MSELSSSCEDAGGPPALPGVFRGRRARSTLFGLLSLSLSLVACARAPERDAPARAATASSPKTTAVSLELLLRIPGEKQNGELGFRFGLPRDIDGDGIAEIAAGARFAALEFPEMGYAGVWSTDGGRELVYWEGHAPNGLFGQCSVIGPDIDADGHADVITGAASGKYFGLHRGVLYARSIVTRRLLWSAVGEVNESIGWDLALAGDQNGDGVEDLFAGAPGKGEEGKAYLLSGRDGSTLRQFVSRETDDLFGWYVAAISDLDGDGRKDLLVGAPARAAGAVPNAGAAYAFSTADGRRLHAWYGASQGEQLGEIVEGLADLDGDGTSEVAVSATFHPNLTGDSPSAGEVRSVSGATDRLVHVWKGAHHRELYGRMIAAAGDLDGDGAGDVAVGAPWSDAGGKSRAGRFEVRSGRTGEVIASVEGDRAEMWLGWHITVGDRLGPAKERGLVVSAVRSEENGLAGAGALHVYVVRRLADR